MTVTCPSIGNAALVLRLLFLHTGVDFIYPPSCEGAEKHEAFRDSPEDMCLPFKLFMVQLEKAWNLGADTVIMPSSAGPCRLGEFCELLKIMLDERGCKYNWIILDVPSDIGVRELLRRFISLFPQGTKVTFIARCSVRAYRILRMLDYFESRVRQQAGYLDDSGRCSRILEELRKQLYEAGGFAEAEALIGHFRWKFESMGKNMSKSPIRILITGEIFSQTEPYASRRIEDRLTDMGVCVYKDVNLSWWVKYTAGGKIASRLSERFSPGRDMLPYNIGGYTRRTVAGTVSSRDAGLDGVIQIMPAGCMPEIVGHAVIDRIAAEKSISAITLVFDEMTGDAGYVTRIEAFVDMLERKKDQNVLSWT